MLQEAIATHLGKKPAKWPPPLPTADFGRVALDEQASLLEAVPRLFPGDGIFSKQPLNMEEYDQGQASPPAKVLKPVVGMQTHLLTEAAAQFVQSSIF